MSDPVKSLADLYRTTRQRHHEVGDEIGQVQAHLAALREEHGEKDRMLKSLVPLMRQLEGGSAAMQAADDEARAKPAQKPAKEASYAALPLAQPAEGKPSEKASAAKGKPSEKAEGPVTFQRS